MSTEETKTYLHNLIDSCPDYYSKEKIFIHMLNTMLRNSSKEFAVDVAYDVNKYISNFMLNSIHICNIINERASYLESYLDGTLYKDDKPEYKEVQKNHAEYIKDLSKALLTDNTQKVIEANYKKQ